MTGSAGTGKTVVALHRAVHLARGNPEARVLLATFSKPLARALAARLESLVGGEPAVAARIRAEHGRCPVAVGASLGGIAGLLALGRAAEEGSEPPFCGLILVDVVPKMDPRGVQLGARGGAHSPIIRPMISFMISLVPP